MPGSPEVPFEYLGIPIEENLNEQLETEVHQRVQNEISQLLYTCSFFNSAEYVINADEHSGAIQFIIEHGDIASALLTDEISKILDNPVDGMVSADQHQQILHHLRLLELCVSPGQEEFLGQLLTNPQITFYPDRSNANSITNNLATSGTFRSIPNLLNFVQTIEQQGEGNGLQVEHCYYDALDALSSMYAIASNEVDVIHFAEIQSAIRQVEQCLTRLDQLQTERQAMDIEYGDHSDYWVDEHDDIEFIDTIEPSNIDIHSFEGDEEEDDYIESLLDRNCQTKATDRLETLKNLHHIPVEDKPQATENISSPELLLQKHHLEYQENNPSPLTPTLGIEIEIREKAVLSSKESKKQTETDENERDALRSKYFHTRRAGIPSGNDAFWEFAHAPSNHYLTLSREVQWLAQQNYIPQEHGRHSLHLTLGGITSVGTQGREAFVLARALEATGWSTTGGRIMRPYLLKQHAWNHKGQAGVNERGFGVELGAKNAIEIRTLQLQTLSGLNRTLASAQYLGAALMAYQEWMDPSTPKSESDPLAQSKSQLAQTWNTFSLRLQSLFNKYGLSSPNLPWLPPYGEDRSGRESMFSDWDREDSSEFTPFAALLNEAANDANSKGGQFVAEVRRLIIRTNAKCTAIIYAKELPNIATSTRRPELDNVDHQTQAESPTYIYNYDYSHNDDLAAD